MGLVVQHNINAMTAYNKMNANVSGLSKASEKLSSGYRINRAGDDAAGLAISEKMRSQIRGLDQAVRNSQDGINMIQTFEGAAQETHSILQRMKELASESANGTYDDATDRAAIQLEFEQLNDELNQIADTDFNGTVVLNGGVMADGLTATDGSFNYKEQYDAAAAAEAATTELLASAQDVTDGDSDRYSTDSAGKILDNSSYSKTDADTIWNALGLDASEVSSIDVTFTYDGANWVATAATNAQDENGNEVSVEVTAEQLQALATTATDNGGFSIDNTTLNAIFDSTNAQMYDYISFTFTNAAGDTYAPTNAGILEDSLDWGTVAAGSTDGATAPTFTLSESITDATMTADLAAVFDKLKETEIGFAYTDGTGSVIGNNITVDADNDAGVTGGIIAVSNTGVITYTATGGTAVNIGSIEISSVDGLTINNGAKFKLDFDGYNYASADELSASSIETSEDAIPTEEALTAVSTNTSGASVSNAFSNSTAILTYTDNITLQTGARSKDAVNFTFNYNVDDTADMGDLVANLNISARADGLNTESLSLANQDDANYAIDQIDKAINKVSMVRATFGSIQNRLEHKIDNLTTTSTNLTEAESNIRDTDMASEMMNYTKYNILQQAAQSMLAQANQQPQSVLQLLG